MQLCDLPDDILTLVLRQSLRARDNRWGLELNLPLVAICRRLRYIALPLVYKDAYMDAFDEYSTFRQRFNVDLSWNAPGHSTPNNQGAYGRWRAVSSVDIIASMGYTGLVQHMRIKIGSDYGHVVGLRHALRHLYNAASEWPAVKQLYISVKVPTVDSSIEYNGEDSDHANEFAEHALALRAMFPNACGLRFADIRPFPAPTFGEQLTQHYHQQLRMLRFDTRADVPPNISFPQVRDLHFVGTRSFPDRFPRVDVAKLERLKLLQVHPLHSWAAFGADNSCHTIEFSALTSLSVDYVAGNNIDSAPAAQDVCSVKLGFPLLRNACIKCPSGPCPVLASAIFPRSMGSLNIQVSAPVWQSISRMELPVATRLQLGILSTTDSDSRLPLSFNRLLANSHQCGEVMLRANYHEPAAYLPSVAFTGLTGLVVEVPISPDMLLDIIGKLPRLVTLIVVYSTSEPILADVAIPCPSECYPIEPLGTKLQTLIYGQEDIRSLSGVDVALCHFIQRVQLYSKAAAYLGIGSGIALGLYLMFRRYETGADVPESAIKAHRKLRGYVLDVSDGDTLRFYHTPLVRWFEPAPEKKRGLSKYTIAVRLYAVDAPEVAHFGNPAQALSAESKDLLSRQVLGKRVTIKPLSRDQYSRVVATVTYSRFFGLLKTNAVHVMLREGMASMYTGGGAQYDGEKELLQRIEAQAKKQKRGIWGLKNYESPAEYKKKHKDK
ncbi:putative endonuclease lcl3 [Coemansia spiralis]|nr:putative endonuclease lcl3 [Coemansia spiralis]